MMKLLSFSVIVAFFLTILVRSCLASSCPALVPVWTSLLAQTRLDTAQVRLLPPYL